MVKNKKFTFTNISKQKDLILINDMKELKQAFNKKQQIIALDNKSKVINPSKNCGSTKPTTRELVLKLAVKLDSFIDQQEKNWQEQRKFNKLILNRIDNLDERINNLVKKNKLKE